MYWSHAHSYEAFCLVYCVALLPLHALGSGTALLAARKHGRAYIGIDASVKYQHVFQ